MDAPAEPGADSGEGRALAEVLALRSLLLNLHVRAAKGVPVAEAEMRCLIERGRDGVKMQRARERLMRRCTNGGEGGRRKPIQRRAGRWREWGRKEYSKAWPSRTPVWTWTAILLSWSAFLAGDADAAEHEGSWTAAERLYLSDYLEEWGAGQSVGDGIASKYTLLEAVVGKGQKLARDGDEIEAVPEPDGEAGIDEPTDEGVKDGISRRTWVAGVFATVGPHRVMSEAVYADHESWEFYQEAGLCNARVLREWSLSLVAVPEGSSCWRDDLETWPQVARAGSWSRRREFFNMKLGSVERG